MEWNCSRQHRLFDVGIRTFKGDIDDSNLSFLCKNMIRNPPFFAIAGERADFSHDDSGRVGEMTIAVPIALAIGLATSLYGQVDRNWPTYQSEQNDKSDKSDDSSKDNSDKGDKSSSEKSKSGETNENSRKDKSAKSDKGSAAGSRGRNKGVKRQE